LVLAIRIGIGDRPSSKKTTAMPSPERPLRRTISASNGRAASQGGASENAAPDDRFAEQHFATLLAELPESGEAGGDDEYSYTVLTVGSAGNCALSLPSTRDGSIDVY
jgi:hypothetical protein